MFLGLPRLRGLYIIKNIAMALVKVIKKYQFDYKFSCLITDNAYNNDDFYNYLL